MFLNKMSGNNCATSMNKNRAIYWEKWCNLESTQLALPNFEHVMSVYLIQEKTSSTADFTITESNVFVKCPFLVQ